MSEHVNIFDIAKEAGVSIATVSRVLSGSANVRAATRDKVMLVVEKYNFRPNMIATGLSRRKSHALGLVLPLVDNPFYAKLFIAALEEAQALGYTLMPYYFTKGTMLAESFVDVLIGKRLDGMVFSGDVSTEATFQQLVSCIERVQRYMPAVVINPEIGGVGCPTMRSDLPGAMRMSIRHLHRLGHQRIAMLGGNGAAKAEYTREYAYAEEMRALGLERHIYPLSVGEAPADGEQGVLRLMTALVGRVRPSAVVAFNDQVALGALKQLKRLGMSIPGDVALMSCDNLFFTPYTDPPLTTVDLAIEDTARQSIRLLAHAQGAALEPFTRVFEPTLVVRESCGATAAMGPHS